MHEHVMPRRRWTKVQCAHEDGGWRPQAWRLEPSGQVCISHGRYVDKRMQVILYDCPRVRAELQNVAFTPAKPMPNDKDSLELPPGVGVQVSPWNI